VKFYLGTHHPHWLWRTDVPLFVSRRSLSLRKVANLTPSLGRWAIDSGSYTELTMHGRWETSPARYIDDVATYVERIGGLDFAAPQDWMCEPHMIERTGLSVREHQERTVANFLELRRQAPELPFIPVLQGWEIADYTRCVDLYAAAGVDLAAEPLVGVGSVCRRQATGEIGHLMSSLSSLSLHGFGVKTAGLCSYGHLLKRGDSLAWSFRARSIANERRAAHLGPLPGCTHQSCANCMRFALDWRARLLDRLDAVQVQPSLFDGAAA
jgi:hypothetical protein